MSAAAEFIGWQRCEGIGEDFPLFDLLVDISGHCAGSTVAEGTLRAAGLAVPEYPIVRRHPSGGFTQAWPQGGSCRVYCGWFASEESAKLDLDGFFAARKRHQVAAGCENQGVLV